MYKRKCIVTSQILPVDQLIKFVMLKNGNILLEKEKKIYGRGAYCKKDIEIIKVLFDRKLLNKSFKTNVSSNLYKELRKEVEDYVKE